MPKLVLHAPLQYVGKTKFAQMLGITYRQINGFLERGVLEPDALVDGEPAAVFEEEEFSLHRRLVLGRDTSGQFRRTRLALTNPAPIIRQPYLCDRLQSVSEICSLAMLERSADIVRELLEFCG